MTIDRRSLLAGGALLGLAATATAQTSEADAAPAVRKRALKDAAVYVPGYFPEYANANGKPLTESRRFMRAIRETDGIKRMISRIGMDGSVRQTLLPVNAHDVEIAPDASVGVLCGFEGGEHCAFDPKTLDMVGYAPSLGEGWRGGGHAQYVDGGKTVFLSERAPQKPAKGGLEPLYGRITIRDSESLKITDSYSTYGVDPHDIRVSEDGKYIVAANYGSVVSEKTMQHTVPRQVVEASITVIDLASGKLVDKVKTGKGSTELRHLAAGRLDRIFAIQSRYGSEKENSREYAGENAAYDFDLTTEPGQHYVSADTLRYDAGTGTVGHMGDRKSRALMRHGLSIRYDSRHDEAIASYPTTHQLMVFDGASGRLVKRHDTRTIGLRYPCGVTFLPDGAHYAVTGYWENLMVFERGTHRLVRDLCLYPLFFGHSHISAA